MDDQAPKLDPSPTPNRGEFKIRWGRIFLVVIPVFLILLQCSGLRVPIIRKLGWINSQLSQEFSLQLPAGTQVIHATYEMSLDASAFYELEFPHGQAEAFIRALAAKLKQQLPDKPDPIEMNDPWRFGAPPPAWWRVGMPTDENKVRFRIEGSNDGYVFFFSPSTDRVFLYWFQY